MILDRYSTEKFCLGHSRELNCLRVWPLWDIQTEKKCQQINQYDAGELVRDVNETNWEGDELVDRETTPKRNGRLLLDGMWHRSRKSKVPEESSRYRGILALLNLVASKV